MPSQARVGQSTVPGCIQGIFALERIKVGTEMGPFVGHMLALTQLNITHINSSVWELYDEYGRLAGYVDGGGVQRPASWLSLIQCARMEKEQNLELLQVGSQIYYRATRDIHPGEELLVWYGASYSLYMGLPSYYSDVTCNYQQKIPAIRGNTKKEHVSAEQEDAITGGGKLKCVLCRRGFNSRSNLRSHMRIHTLEKPFVCTFCGRRFSQSSTLRNHVRLHTGEKPYKCVVCRSSYSQLAGLRAHQRSAAHKLDKAG
ncbi:hypothetical protein CHS0354_034043 [Potamilus streckersoni]|uniref:PR domain zinc finger protein 12 n=1 Tax=Potamilus streckersoni TaxID=2493646 RepID=A0AAE0TJP9_9BIVA|nr:hypothetical protein CHS0354_034043 [Potamilus streckersoni]